MTRVVVSGATGFLGMRLCARLKTQGCEVLGLGRDEVRGAALTSTLGVPFEAVDLASLSAIRSWRNADAFVHAAALSSAWGPREAFERANVAGTRNAIAIASALGARRFVFVSSPSIYFRFCDQTGVREGASLPVPVNDYAATKVIAEDLVRGAGLNSIILRPRGIYGPGDTALLPRLVRAAAKPLPLLRKGRAVTDLTYVDDVVDAIFHALTAPDILGGHTYNISSGEAVAIRDIITQSAAAAGITARFQGLPVAIAMAAARTAEMIARRRKDQPEPLVTAYGMGILAYSQTLDISAARAELGFRPRFDFAEGLRRTFAS